MGIRAGFRQTVFREISCVYRGKYHTLAAHEVGVVSFRFVSYYCSMGLYDRDYAYDRQPGYHVSAPQSITVQLILINAGVYVLQMLFQDDFARLFVLNSNWFERPWNFYRLLTYGFLHSQSYLPHILFNMIGLYMFGSQIERVYGRTKFLWMYLTAIVFAGLCWSFTETASGAGGVMLGASGGVVAVVILFALHFPHVKGMVFPLPIPIPMWVLACFLVLMDLGGAIRQSGEVAFTAHLGGALYGWIFYKTGWTPAGLIGGWQLPKRKPKLRVRSVEDVEPDEEDEVDAILRKIQEQGQDSLSWRERRVLEKASRDYKSRRGF